MRDIKIEKNRFYQETDFKKLYPTKEKVRFLYKENFDQDIPEMVVVGPTKKDNKYVKWLLLIIVALLVTVAITACSLYKTKYEQKYPIYHIKDENGEILLDSYTLEKQIDIFKDPLLGGEKIIYPGREGTYYFYISNENSYRFNFSIYFEAINESNINMQYRFRVADVKYTHDEWKNVDEVGLTNFTIDANTQVLCALDWTWLSSDSDTEIGLEGLATYTLKIHFRNFKKAK